jgi:glycosidase
LIAARRGSEALRSGALFVVETGTPDVLAWGREAGDERLLVVVNFAPEERTTDVARGAAIAPLVGTHRLPSAPTEGAAVRLRPLEGVVFRAD